MPTARPHIKKSTVDIVKRNEIRNRLTAVISFEFFASFETFDALRCCFSTIFRRLNCTFADSSRNDRPQEDMFLKMKNF